MNELEAIVSHSMQRIWALVDFRGDRICRHSFFLERDAAQAAARGPAT